MLKLSIDALTDLAFSYARLGFGLFETLGIEGGRARFLALHLERLGRGAAFLGMDAPPSLGETERFLAKEAGIASFPAGVLRLIAIDDRILVSLGPVLPATPSRVEVAVARGIVRLSSSPLNKYKTISRMENELLAREAASRGLFDAIALNERGELSDGSRASLFLLVGDRILTPRECDGALPGIARRVLLESGIAREARLDPSDLGSCRAAFLANSLRGILPIHRLEGRELEQGCAAIEEARERLGKAAENRR